MLLEGSCHCGGVRFRVQSHTPYPYMRCYCSICRKTAGGGGYAVNIMGLSETLEVTGKKNIAVYMGRRRFCRRCGNALWVWDERWPGLMHPFASAIDTPLPMPPEYQHIMLAYRAPWVDVPLKGKRHRHFTEYPCQSIEGWHKLRKLLVE